MKWFLVRAKNKSLDAIVAPRVNFFLSFFQHVSFFFFLSFFFFPPTTYVFRKKVIETSRDAFSDSYVESIGYTITTSLRRCWIKDSKIWVLKVSAWEKWSRTWEFIRHSRNWRGQKWITDEHWNILSLSPLQKCCLLSFILDIFFFSLFKALNELEKFYPYCAENVKIALHVIHRSKKRISSSDFHFCSLNREAAFHETFF